MTDTPVAYRHTGQRLTVTGGPRHAPVTRHSSTFLVGLPVGP